MAEKAFVLIDDDIQWGDEVPTSSNSIASQNPTNYKDEFLALQEQSFGKEELTDFTVQVGDQIFKVNSYFLCLHSTVFTSYLSNDSEEKRTRTINIKDLDPELVKSMLKFMYSGKVENLDQIAHDLYIIADRYDVKILQKICLNHMFNNLDMQYIFKCLELAFELNIEELKQKSIDFAISNVNEVQSHDEWEPLMQRCPQIGITFMRRLTAESNELKKRNEELESRRCPHQVVQPEERSVMGRESFASIDQYLQEIEQFNALLVSRRSEFERALAAPSLSRRFGEIRAPHQMGMGHAERMRQLREMNEQVRDRLQNIMNDANNGPLRQNRDNAGNDDVVVVAEVPQRQPPQNPDPAPERREDRIERSRREMRRLQNDIDRDRNIIRCLNMQYQEIEARQNNAVNEEANMELNSLRVRRRVLEEHLDNLRQRFLGVSNELSELQRGNRQFNMQRRSAQEFQELERHAFLNRRRPNPFALNEDGPPVQRQNLEPPRLVEIPLQRADLEEQREGGAGEPPQQQPVEFEPPNLANLPAVEEIILDDNVVEPPRPDVPPPRQWEDVDLFLQIERQPGQQVGQHVGQQVGQEPEQVARPPQHQNNALHDHDYLPFLNNAPSDSPLRESPVRIVHEIDSNDEDILFVESGQGSKRHNRSKRINYREDSPERPGPSRRLPAVKRAPKTQNKKRQSVENQKSVEDGQGSVQDENLLSTSKASQKETKAAGVKKPRQRKSKGKDEIGLGQENGQENGQNVSQEIDLSQELGQNVSQELEEAPGPSQQKDVKNGKTQKRKAPAKSKQGQNDQPETVRQKRKYTKKEKRPPNGVYPFELDLTDDEN